MRLALPKIANATWEQIRAGVKQREQLQAATANIQPATSPSPIQSAGSVSAYIADTKHYVAEEVLLNTLSTSTTTTANGKEAAQVSGKSPAQIKIEKQRAEKEARRQAALAGMKRKIFHPLKKSYSPVNPSPLAEEVGVNDNPQGLESVPHKQKTNASRKIDQAEETDDLEKMLEEALQEEAQREQQHEEERSRSKNLKRKATEDATEQLILVEKKQRTDEKTASSTSKTSPSPSKNTTSRKQDSDSDGEQPVRKPGRAAKVHTAPPIVLSKKRKRNDAEDHSAGQEQPTKRRFREEEIPPPSKEERKKRKRADEEDAVASEEHDAKRRFVVEEKAVAPGGVKRAREEEDEEIPQAKRRFAEAEIGIAVKKRSATAIDEDNEAEKGRRKKRSGVA